MTVWKSSSEEQANVVVFRGTWSSSTTRILEAERMYDLPNCGVSPLKEGIVHNRLPLPLSVESGGHSLFLQTWPTMELNEQWANAADQTHLLGMQTLSEGFSEASPTVHFHAGAQTESKGCGTTPNHVKPLNPPRSARRARRVKRDFALSVSVLFVLALLLLRPVERLCAVLSKLLKIRAKQNSRAPPGSGVQARGLAEREKGHFLEEFEFEESCIEMLSEGGFVEALVSEETSQDLRGRPEAPDTNEHKVYQRAVDLSSNVRFALEQIHGLSDYGNDALNEYIEYNRLPLPLFVETSAHSDTLETAMTFELHKQLADAGKASQVAQREALKFSPEVPSQTEVTFNEKRGGPGAVSQTPLSTVGASFSTDRERNAFPRERRFSQAESQTSRLSEERLGGSNSGVERLVPIATAAASSFASSEDAHSKAVLSVHSHPVRAPSLYPTAQPFSEEAGNPPGRQLLGLYSIFLQQQRIAAQVARPPPGLLTLTKPLKVLVPPEDQYQARLQRGESLQVSRQAKGHSKQRTVRGSHQSKEQVDQTLAAPPPAGMLPKGSDSAAVQKALPKGAFNYEQEFERLVLEFANATASTLREKREELVEVSENHPLFAVPTVEHGVLRAHFDLGNVFAYPNAAHSAMAAVTVQKLFSSGTVDSKTGRSIIWKFNHLLRMLEPAVQENESLTFDHLFSKLSRSFLVCDLVWMYRKLCPSSVPDTLYYKIVHGVEHSNTRLKTYNAQKYNLSSIAFLTILMNYYRRGDRPNAVLVVLAKQMIFNKSQRLGFPFEEFMCFFNENDISVLRELGIRTR